MSTSKVQESWPGGSDSHLGGGQAEQPGAGEDCFLTSLTSGDTGEDEAADVEPLEGAGQQREAWEMAGT